MPQCWQFARPTCTSSPQLLHVITIVPHFHQAAVCVSIHNRYRSVSFFFLLDNDSGVTMRHIGMIQYTNQMTSKSTIHDRALFMLLRLTRLVYLHCSH